MSSTATPPFTRVVVHPDVEDLEFTTRFLAKLPGSVAVEHSDRDVKGEGRSVVHMVREPGEFIKPCPCTPGVIGCGYWVMSLGFQCPYSCSYCFLRFYGPEEPLTLYGNLEDCRAQFEEAVKGWAGPVRLGTGEFTDSLALDPWTNHSRWLVGLVEPHPNVLLELKTKSAEVAGLLELEPLPNLVVGWSVNPEHRISTDEAGAATLDERLAAAEEAVRAGYKVAFHFDPIIAHGDWRGEYEEVVRSIFAKVPPERVAWISLGTLRFPQRFLDRWGARLRGKEIFFDEFVPGEDGKLRYFWPLRRQVYSFMAKTVERHGGAGHRVYLCMEPGNMWRRGLGLETDEETVAAELTEGLATDRD